MRLSELTESLVAKHNLAPMISELRAARPVLTTPAHYEPPPVPVSFSLGPDAVAEFGISRARNALPDYTPASQCQSQDHRNACQYQCQCCLLRFSLINLQQRRGA
ncbi:DUF6177 family protein [Streptomyces sp. NPDC002586]